MAKFHTRNNDGVKHGRLKKIGLMLCLLPNFVLSQEDIVVFHNTENLFFPTDNRQTMDDDYTSEGKKHWTFKKYNKKLNDLAKTYIAIDEKQMPSVIGLCEVENDTVLRALVLSTPLRKAGYKYIHYPSKDIRGIDVALLYNPKRFAPQEHYTLPSVSDKEEDRTRDVLYAKGVLGNIPINIYVVHAPSRRENNVKKKLREEIFSQIYSHINTLYLRGERNFLVMGDFNDNPWDETVINGFRFNEDAVQDSVRLVSLMQDNKDVVGSYVYGRKYLSFDQFVVSEQLKEKIVYDGNFNRTHVFKPSFLVEKGRYNKVDKPFSVYKGLKYQGGISDHFPIILKLSTK